MNEDSNLRDEETGADDVAGGQLAILEALIESGQFERGYEFSRNLLAEDPDSAMVHFIAGICATQIGAGPDKALEHFEFCLKQEPEFMAAHLELSRLFFAEKKFRKALGSVRTAIELEPEEAVAWCQLGWCEWAVGNKEAALDCAEQALRLDPDNLAILVVCLFLKLAVKPYRVVVSPVLMRKAGHPVSFGRGFQWLGRMPNWVFQLGGLVVAGVGWGLGIKTIAWLPMHPHLWILAVGFFLFLLAPRAFGRSRGPVASFKKDTVAN